ncbi:uncharacterized protein L3040_009508 [Drepanopeziza brunnea f. sp. 'multigermtubi']|uniref:Vacuolar protein sorting/targeting protein 10 n=1 Tax=Marssonina brunnea f. sp. multigermtubi (strain MB_m1) TaxID=1072389 RepID=K1X6J4_MARBU|nr:vacuolar protein sorting/targeting protein PEP1 [Drepanopeziza brunnea f. sp. 'multigermtubi' MB_m1]EKD16258.1 vacuolar protein sorting/targeting protein PEP1 [Drepanopeziza brunnea f. sp. 'multigermtubi' MB_m1]KAJ5032919.1 hypothetical protein L3040_009508 [Drepanopeziza brunnea f. sp. 'multigermtubi']
MRLHSTAVGWRSLLLPTLLIGAWAKNDKPDVKSNKFDFIPYNVNYFDDSDVVLMEDPLSNDVYRSQDTGVTWEKIDGPSGKVLEVSMHPYDKKRAFILTTEKIHYKTNDQGKTWEKFEAKMLASIFREPLTYHAGDPDRIIFNAMDCTGIFCDEVTMYTIDGFAKGPEILRIDTSGCHWAKSSEVFTTGQEDLDKNRILCIVKGRFSPWKKDFRLLISDNYFEESKGAVQEFEPELESGRTVQGIVNMAVVKPFLIVAASAEKTDEMALYVSDDAVKWHRAVFPHDHKLTEEAYTVLESTNYSIQIDVMNGRPSNPTGVFLSSNSNGTFFTRNIEHTNRNSYGLVDFEKVYGIQGIILVNIVDNWEDVEKQNAEKKIKTKISFDDGRTWEDLSLTSDDKRADTHDLHLHSVTDISNSGRVFSSPSPGLVMGIGNRGEHLKDYEDGNLYVSDDAGWTWREALTGPHKYEFGDQGSILVAMKEGPGTEVRYSIDHGKNWDTVELPETVRPVQLTTIPDSTSLKFLLEAADKDDLSPSGYLFVLDFAGMHESQCKDDDMEKWYARIDDDGKPSCLMGQKQSYLRRKAGADCFLNKVFEDPEVISEKCPCTDIDFECDYNFVRSKDRKECEKAGDLVVPEGACKAFGPDDTFKGSSGWRLIPGNNCEKLQGEKYKDDLVDRKCVDAIGEPASGKPGDASNGHGGKKFSQKIYLERTGISDGSDETVIMRTDAGIFISQNHGKQWQQMFKDQPIYAIYAHPHFNDMVFFITGDETVYYSTDRGKNVRKFKAPDKPNEQGYPVLGFHPKNKDWLIWMGARDCPGRNCHTVASITLDRGDGDWKTLQRYVRKCEFIAEPESGYLVHQPTPKIDEKSRDKLMYCEVRARESNDQRDNPYKLVSSDDFFNEQPTEHFTNVVDFASMSEFIVVATKNETASTLKVDTSVNGLTFADAKFPYGFDVPHQSGYTVLDSSTHSVFLHVTISNEEGLEYGSIIKSNSNGTSYTLSLDAVDRDTLGYVDFEKMFGIEGIAMVNIVANYKDKNFKKDRKKLKTMITHNDGAEWAYLTPPKEDADKKKYPCGGSSLEKCSLNIHGYTERSDKSHTYSSKSAIGLMLGTGNVGEYLTSMKDANTFMTADGGVTWMEVMKGSYMWEFGDQGSIVVIVKERVSTNVVHYSLDEGKTWTEYKFAEKEIEVDDLTTMPSDNSRNFLLWGTDGNDLVTINLDFSGLTDAQCKLNEDDVEADDYYLWTPKHPMQSDDCLFGHVSSYHRKRTDKACYNGKMIPHIHNIERNCTCTRRDFECDYNFQRQSDGSCALVEGFTPYDHSLYCLEDENRIEYDEPTGYRRIPLSTCQGGKEMDKSIQHPCPGHGKEFEEKHGVSSVALFFAIVLPFAAAGAIGYYLWQNYDKHFGAIRLGEQSSLDQAAPYIKYPIMAMSAIAATLAATSLLFASLWRSAGSAFGTSRPARFTTRDSFARGRGDYGVVDNDEGELLGDESDDEV